MCEVRSIRRGERRRRKERGIDLLLCSAARLDQCFCCCTLVMWRFPHRQSADEGIVSGSFAAERIRRQRVKRMQVIVY